MDAKITVLTLGKTMTRGIKKEDARCGASSQLREVRY